jgi:hypothetical protein
MQKSIKIMDNQENKKLTREGIRKILEFLPQFQDKSFIAGQWHSSRKIGKNTSSFPYFEYSDLVSKFIQTLYDEGLIYHFDWSSWNYGIKLTQNHNLLQKANLLTLRKLITAHIRRERFCEGHLASAFQSGLVIRVLERIQRIADYQQ